MICASYSRMLTDRFKTSINRARVHKRPYRPYHRPMVIITHNFALGGVLRGGASNRREGFAIEAVACSIGHSRVENRDENGAVRISSQVNVHGMAIHISYSLNFSEKLWERGALT